MDSIGGNGGNGGNCCFLAVWTPLAVTAAFTVHTVLTFFGTDNTVHRTYQSVLGTVCGGCTDSL